MNLQTPLKSFEPQSGIRAYLIQLELSRAKVRKVLMIGGPLLVALISAFLWKTGGRYVSTDNAYIRAPKLMVSTDVSGLVTEVRVREGQGVRKGDVLFSIDAAAFAIAVENAKAQLAQTVLNLQSMKLDYRRMLSDGAAQLAQVQLAQANYDRAQRLIKTGATTGATFDQARFALIAAQKQQQSMDEQAKVLLAKLGGTADTAVTEHPTYLQAKSQLDEMQRQLDHTIIRAPFNGVVTQVGQLQPGTFLVAATAGLTNTGAVALVGTDSLWIDANFKETDLTWAREGNDVDVTVDTFPGRVWKATVASIAPASGSEFSILPAQNASGNWVKVVQRIPVKIELQPESNGPALRAGMSVNVTIDTQHRRTLSELW